MTWLKLVLGLVALLRQFTTFLHDKQMIKAGEDKVIAASLAKASEEILLANKTSEEAKKIHNKVKTDEAFDQEFRRDK